MRYLWANETSRRLGWGLLVMVLATSGSQARGQFPGNNLPTPYPGKTAQAGLHRIHSADSPPGVLGQARLQRWGAVGGYFQPVAFYGPESTAFSMAVDGHFLPPTASPPLRTGLLVGAVYRFQVTSIPGHEGEELFPTVELLDRTYPPHHLAARHPIPIHLELDDLREALGGRLVTRVVYLEDTATALPIESTASRPQTLDVPANQDPLHVADSLGKPVAIIRIGSVTPPPEAALLPRFFFGFPPWMAIDADPSTADTPTANAPTANVPTVATAPHSTR